MGSFVVFKIFIKSVFTVSALAWLWMGFMVFKGKLYKDEKYCSFMMPISIFVNAVFSVSLLLLMK